MIRRILIRRDSFGSPNGKIQYIHLPIPSAVASFILRALIFFVTRTLKLITGHVWSFHGDRQLRRGGPATLHTLFFTKHFRLHLSRVRKLLILFISIPLFSRLIQFFVGLKNKKKKKKRPLFLFSPFFFILHVGSLKSAIISKLVKIVKPVYNEQFGGSTQKPKIK